MSAVRPVSASRPLPHSTPAVRWLEGEVEIPPIASLSDFRRWALSDEFPERGRIDYVAGTVEIDMSPKSMYSHSSAELAILRTIANRVHGDDLGEVHYSEMRISCPEADLSAEPDVIVILHETFESGRVRLTPKADRPADFIEIEGPPDLVVEVVSDSSVTKDTRRLPPAYFAAGVREFWLVDARRDPLAFRLQTRGESTFEDVSADPDGFRRSAVLGRRYRLDRSAGRRGEPRYDLREET